MPVSARWLRGVVAVGISLPIALCAWVLFGFVVPGYLMGLMAPWSDRPIGSGLGLFIWFVCAAPFVLILECVLCVRVYRWLTPMPTAASHGSTGVAA